MTASFWLFTASTKAIDFFFGVIKRKDAQIPGISKKFTIGWAQWCPVRTAILIYR